MSESPELEQSLWATLVTFGIPAIPIVASTPWGVGPVTAYLLPTDPITLIDAGMDDDQTRSAITHALNASGHELTDLERVIITHAHSDHVGSAKWLQEQTNCEILVADVEAERWQAWYGRRKETIKEIYLPLGVPKEHLDAWFGSGDDDWFPLPSRLTTCGHADKIQAGGRTFTLEIHPGHTPGHLLVVDDDTQAIFAGDHLLATGPSNAGVEPDETHPLGRMPLLSTYMKSLEALTTRDVPVMFCGHGPAVTDVKALATRRLRSNVRRNEHHLAELIDAGPSSALEFARVLYGERLDHHPWGFLTDVVARLDYLFEVGSVTFKSKEGVQIFEAV